MVSFIFSVFLCSGILYATDVKVAHSDDFYSAYEGRQYEGLIAASHYLNQHGLTVFLTTHDMEEAEKLCRRVAIMDHGKILALDTPANLSKLVPAGTRVELRVHYNATFSEEKKAAILTDVRALDSVTGAEWTTARAQASSPAGGPPPLGLTARQNPGAHHIRGPVARGVRPVLLVFVAPARCARRRA